MPVSLQSALETAQENGWLISLEKLMFIGIWAVIWLFVIAMEKWLPHQNAALIMLGLMALYSMFIAAANLHHRRKLAKGTVDITPSNPQYQPHISVVVPAHNEVNVIAHTVQTMMALDYPNYDVWVVDDRSTDGTDVALKTIAEQYHDKLHVVIRHPDAMPGKSAVLNEIFAQSKANVIAVFDADAQVSPDFLTRIVPYLCEPSVGAVQARKIILNAYTNTWTRCQHHEYCLDAYAQSGRDVVKSAVELRGNGQLIKREALNDVDGWTEDTVTDDLDLSTKLHLAGWDIRFAPDVHVLEEGIVHFRPLLRQRRRWAEGSLKRYLEHGRKLFAKVDISRRVRADMIAYFLHFIFPLWVLADITVQGLNWAFDEWPSHLTSSFIVFPAMAVVFLSGLFVAIRHYEKPPFLTCFWYALETALFMLIVWVPVVMVISAKVLITRNEGPLNWDKTEHLGIQEEVAKRSRFERFKKLIQPLVRPAN